MDADPGRRHRAGGRRRRRPAHEAGLAEERDLVGVGGAEQVEAGVVREGEEPLAARPGAGGDVRHPVEQERLQPHHRVPAGVGAVDVAGLGGRIEVAVPRLEDVGVDRQEPEAAHRLDEVGGVDHPPHRAAVGRADREAAGGERVVGAERALPVQVVRPAEEAEVRHRGERRRVAAAVHLGGDDARRGGAGGRGRVAGDERVAAVRIEEALALVAAVDGVEVMVARRREEAQAVPLAVAVEERDARAHRRRLAVVGEVAEHRDQPDPARDDVVEQRRQRREALVEHPRRTRRCRPACGTRRRRRSRRRGGSRRRDSAGRR